MLDNLRLSHQKREVRWLVAALGFLAFLLTMTHIIWIVAEKSYRWNYTGSLDVQLYADCLFYAGFGGLAALISVCILAKKDLRKPIRIFSIVLLTIAAARCLFSLIELGIELFDCLEVLFYRTETFQWSEYIRAYFPFAEILFAYATLLQMLSFLLLVFLVSSKTPSGTVRKAGVVVCLICTIFSGALIFPIYYVWYLPHLQYRWIDFVTIVFQGFPFLFLGIALTLTKTAKERIVIAKKAHAIGQTAEIGMRVGDYIFLCLITLGIFYFVWIWKIMRVLRRQQGESELCAGEMICFLLVPFYSWYWFYTRSQKFNGSLQIGQANAQEPFFRVSPGFNLLLALLGFPIIAASFLQGEINDRAKFCNP